MLKNDLERLRDYILQYNTYFSNGYSDAFQNHKGIVVDGKAIFPNDTLGDYFYLRQDGSVKFREDRTVAISDCHVGMVARSSVVLVAAVKDASEDRLLSNLTNTLLAFNGDIVLTDALFNKEAVLLQEMRGADKEAVEAGLQRLQMSQTLVSVRFDLSKPLNTQKPNCNSNPCKC